MKKSRNCDVTLLFFSSWATFPTGICKTTMTRKEYNLTESTLDKRNFVFEGRFKTDQFACALFTDIAVQKLSRIIVLRNKKKLTKSLFTKHCQVYRGLEYISVQLPVICLICLSLCCLVPRKNMLPSKKPS